MLIVLDDAGTDLLFLKVSKQQKIREIKGMISAKMNKPISSLILLDKDQTLADSQDIESYGIRPGGKIKLIIKNCEKGTQNRQISKKNPVLTEIAAQNSSVFYSKLRFSASSRLLPSHISKGPILPSNHPSSQSKSTSSLSSKTVPIPPSIPMSSEPSLPNYRSVFHGLSIPGICRNEACPAFNDLVYVNKGFGLFRYPEISQNSRCSKCGETIGNQRGNCGFFKAKWRVVGVSEEGVRDSEEGETTGDDYVLWNPGKTDRWAVAKLMVCSVFTSI